MNKDAMIAALIFGGSGSGGGSVTPAEKMFVVNFSKENNAIVADKTKAEIEAAIAAGQTIAGLAPGTLFGDDNIPLVQLFLTNTQSASGPSTYLYFQSGVYRYLPSETFATYQIEGVIAGGNLLWNGATKNMNYLPIVSGADNGKVLGVSNGAWGAVADKGEPFYVTFTITGAAVDNIYPLSADKTILEIGAAITAGKNVIALCNMGGQDTPQANIIDTWFDNGSLLVVSFGMIGMLNGVPMMGLILDNAGTSISLTVVPLSTAQMTYDSATQTLAIVDPFA